MGDDQTQPNTTKHDRFSRGIQDNRGNPTYPPLGGLEPYHRTKAGKHWVMLRSHPYRHPYRAVPGVPKWLRVGELMVERRGEHRTSKVEPGEGGLGYFTRQPVNPLGKIGDYRGSTRQPLAIIERGCGRSVQICKNIEDFERWSPQMTRQPPVRKRK